LSKYRKRQKKTEAKKKESQQRTTPARKIRLNSSCGLSSFNTCFVVVKL
jgi:hypothetical protein